MIGKKTVSETPISNVEAREILERLEKEYIAKGKTIGYEVEQSLKYAKKHGKLSVKEYDAIYKKLEAMKIPRKAIIEIINTSPKQEETLKTILLKKFDFNESKIKEIMEIIK